ncbi:phosphoesterase family-domain-containing protein [Syncephalastrum racemosum]|uniref:Phosphoesterase family-domain-containing protein n=1 Tax=Syncephalastrum racemosum TaxID=13706 RepID=A0A1X2HM52_SYNRA|nr:phosphoesterase family-domain-containing protein [Syncephalastrum racemosum]
MQIWFENQDFDVIDAIDEFKALAKEGVLLTNFNAITHPSEPNYVAAVGGSSFGITTDDYYNIPANVTNLFDLLEAKGLTWKSYQEDIPSTCWTGYTSEDGLYVRKHNPPIIYDSIGLNKTRCANIVNAKELEKDIENETMPNWSFYTPNMLNDAHTSDTNATYAANWLKGFWDSTLNNPKLLDSTLVIITFDETDNYQIRNRVWTLLFGAVPDKVKGTEDNTFYTHYSTLKLVEENWDLGSLGRNDENKMLTNIFNIFADDLHYKNLEVPEAEIPWMNDTLTGMMTGKFSKDAHQ